MQGTLRASDVEFVSLPTAVFCVQCELISANNTPNGGILPYNEIPAATAMC